MHVTEMREVTIKLPKDGVCETRPIVVERGGGSAYIAGQRPLKKDLQVVVQRAEKDDYPEWTLKGTTLHWQPTRTVIEGFVTKDLFCKHPSGRVCQFRLTEHRSEAMVVQGLGVCGGALVISVQWTWDSKQWRKQSWFKGLASKFRSQYVHLNPSTVEQHRCICLLYTSPSPRDKRQSRMPSSA